MVDSTAAWGPGDSGIKPVKDAGRRQYLKVLASPRTTIRRRSTGFIRHAGSGNQPS